MRAHFVQVGLQFRHLLLQLLPVLGEDRQELAQLRAGVPHGGEIGYVFGALTDRPGSTVTTEDQAVSRLAQNYWVNFAKTGDPNGAGLPTWPRHDSKTDLIFDFRPDGSAGAGPDARKARLDVTQLNTDAGKRSDP